MKVYEVPLNFAKHIDILSQDIRRAFTRPLVLCYLHVRGHFLNRFYFIYECEDTFINMLDSGRGQLCGVKRKEQM